MRCAKWALAALAAVGTSAAAHAPCFGGAVGGPKTRTTDVRRNGSDLYKIAFYSNEQALVRVIGDGDTTLRVAIYDENGNLIDVDTDGDGTGYCLARFTPRWTGVFIVRVTNSGGVYNHYTIDTN
jgi:hypothetical protein